MSCLNILVLGTLALQKSSGDSFLLNATDNFHQYSHPPPKETYKYQKKIYWSQAKCKERINPLRLMVRLDFPFLQSMPYLSCFLNWRHFLTIQRKYRGAPRPPPTKKKPRQTVNTKTKNQDPINEVNKSPKHVCIILNKIDSCVKTKKTVTFSLVPP